MGASFRKPVEPSPDKRWRIVDASMRRYGNPSHALMGESFGASVARTCFVGPRLVPYGHGKTAQAVVLSMDGVSAAHDGQKLEEENPSRELSS